MASTKKPPGKDAKPASPPKALEGEALKKANQVFAKAKAKALTTITRLLQEQGAPSVATKTLIAELAKVTSATELEAWARAHVGRINIFVQRQVTQQIGDDVSVKIDLALPARTRSALVRNVVESMRKIPLAVALRAAPLLHRAIEQGLRGDDIADELGHNVDVSGWQARKLAVGSTIRANAELTKLRHTQAGITQYKWRASPDKHTRRWHADLNNTVQRYADPPIGGGGGPKDVGNPGSADTCRCQAIPILPVRGE